MFNQSLDDCRLRIDALSLTASTIEAPWNGRSRGFGFIEMSTKEGAAAIQKLNGQELGGRALRVNEAKPRENRAGFS